MNREYKGNCSWSIISVRLRNR